MGARKNQKNCVVCGRQVLWNRYYYDICSLKCFRKGHMVDDFDPENGRKTGSHWVYP